MNQNSYEDLPKYNHLGDYIDSGKRDNPCQAYSLSRKISRTMTQFLESEENYKSYKKPKRYSIDWHMIFINEVQNQIDRQPFEILQTVWQTIQEQGIPAALDLIAKKYNKKSQEHENS